MILRKSLRTAATIVAGLAVAVVPLFNVGLAHATSWGVSGTTLVSADSGGTPADQAASSNYVTPDGRYVAYNTAADNIISGTGGVPTGNTIRQGYLYDRTAGTTEIVSRNNSGTLADGDTAIIGLSNNGRYVLMTSLAHNLGYSSPNNTAALYLRDRTAGTTQLVSLSTLYSTATSRFSLSADGSKVLYLGQDGNAPSSHMYLYLYDTTTSTTTAVTPAYGVGSVALNGSISRDGSSIIYYTQATPGSATFYQYDVATATTTAVGYPSSSVTAVAFSPDATQFAYMSGSLGTAQVYRMDVATGTETAEEYIGDPRGLDSISFSDDDRYLSYGLPTTTNRVINLYVKDLLTGTSLQVASSAARDSGGGLDGDGSHIVYTSGTGTGQTYETDITLPPPDTTAPILGTPSWSLNPKSSSDSSDLTVPATDDVGVTGGEYYLGTTDPGQGNATPMTVDGSGNLAATFDSSLASGLYKVTVRGRDAAGNWSGTVSDYLAVFDPARSTTATNGSVTPALSHGDVMPGLNSTTQTNKATFTYNVSYNVSGQIASGSAFQLSYNTGTLCGIPILANNCHTTTLSASSLNWFVTEGSNDSTGMFQGTGTLTVDGTGSTAIFRVTGIDGARLTPTGSDQVQVEIFHSTDNPNTATPWYVIHSAALAGGNVQIN